MPAFLFGAVLAAAGCNDAPPVFLLTIDALRADHLSTYGYERATDPNIRAIAEDGVVFTRAFTTAPKTTPAYASMFTGLYPHKHGLRMLGQELAEENLTLAEMLSAEGYDTGGFVSSTVMLGRLSALDQGFLTWDDYMPHREANRANFERRADATADAVLAWLDRPSSPRFLFVHFIDPHGPYHPPGVFRRRFANRAGRSPAHSMRLRAEDVPAFQRLADARTLGDYIDAYDGEIAYADAALGRILDRLRALGLYDDALVIVTADHGESLGEDGFYFRHGKTLREVSTRIPLIIKPPGGRRPGVSRFWHDAVSLVDVLPTVADFAGLSGRTAGRDGVSLRAVLEGRARRGERVVFSQREGAAGLRRAAHGRSGTYLREGCADSQPPGACRAEFVPARATSPGPRGRSTPGPRAGLARAVDRFDLAAGSYRRPFSTSWRYRPGDKERVEKIVGEHNASFQTYSRDDRRALESLGYLD